MRGAGFHSNALPVGRGTAFNIASGAARPDPSIASDYTESGDGGPIEVSLRCGIPPAIKLANCFSTSIGTGGTLIKWSISPIRKLEIHRMQMVTGSFELRCDLFQVPAGTVRCRCNRRWHRCSGNYTPWCERQHRQVSNTASHLGLNPFPRQSTPGAPRHRWTSKRRNSEGHLVSGSYLRIYTIRDDRMMNGQRGSA